MKKSYHFLIVGLSLVLFISIILNIFVIRKMEIARKTANELDKALNYVSVIVTSEEKQKFAEEMDEKYKIAFDNKTIVPMNEEAETFIANEILSAASD